MEEFFPAGLQILNTVGLIVLGILYVVKASKSQSTQIDATTIASLKAQVEVVQSEVNLYKGKVLELTQLVGKQDGIIQTQKETIDKYEKILQNRNPELTEVLKEIRDFMKKLDDNTTQAMEELSYQTRLIDKNEERQTKIDKTHAAIVGQPPSKT